MNYYFHVPFCASKCGYCAFYSLPGAGGALMDAYLDQLIKDLEAETGETFHPNAF